MKAREAASNRSMQRSAVIWLHMASGSYIGL